jgi:hypothetical protein
LFIVSLNRLGFKGGSAGNGFSLNEFGFAELSRARKTKSNDE